MLRAFHKATNSSKIILNTGIKELCKYFNCGILTRQFAKPASLDLSGIFPPIITPFDDKYNVSLEKLAFNLDRWKEMGFSGYVLMGSTGEFPLLNESEKVDLAKFMRKNCDRLIIVGTGCQSTSETIKLTNAMADIGADAALVISPFFYKNQMTEDLLYNHYTAVADSSKIPIILYNVPANTGLDLSASLVAKLADHPNIIGLKDSDGNITKISLIVHKTKNKGFQVLAGSAGFLYPALSVGCVGGILALSNTLGAESCLLYKYFRAGKMENCMDLHVNLIEPNLAVTKLFGVPGVKASMELKGLYGGPCRLPSQPLTEQKVKELKDIFERSGFC